MNSFFFNDKQSLYRYKPTKLTNLTKPSGVPIKLLGTPADILSKTENFIIMI